MAQCVVCSEDLDAATAKRFDCCDAEYCDGCHAETTEAGTCGECFADISAETVEDAAAARDAALLEATDRAARALELPPPPPADCTPQLAPAMRPVTPYDAVAAEPTLVALGTPSDAGTPVDPRARLVGDMRRVVLRKVDGNSPRSSPPHVPSPKVVTALQSGALRSTGSDVTPRTGTVNRFRDAEVARTAAVRASAAAARSATAARETAAAAQAVQEAAVAEASARHRAAASVAEARAAAARARAGARAPRAVAPSARPPRRRSKSPMRRPRPDLEAGPAVAKMTVAVAELSAANRKRSGAKPRRSGLRKGLAALFAGLLAFGAVSFYAAHTVLEAPSLRHGAMPPPRKRSARRYLGTNSAKKKRLRGSA